MRGGRAHMCAGKKFTMSCKVSFVVIFNCHTNEIVGVGVYRLYVYSLGVQF